MRRVVVAATVAAGLLAAPVARATTIDFSGSGYDGYVVTGGKIAMNGCPYDALEARTTPCLQFNGPGNGVVSRTAGLFDLLGVKFQLRGPDDATPNGVTFQALDLFGAVLSEARFYVGLDTGSFGDAWIQDGNVPIVRLDSYTLLFGDSFRGIARLRIFSDDPGQNVRLDDFEVQAHVVPVPAAGTLLAAAVAAFAAMGRRRRA